MRDAVGLEFFACIILYSQSTFPTNEEHTHKLISAVLIRNSNIRLIGYYPKILLQPWTLKLNYQKKRRRRRKRHYVKQAKQAGKGRRHHDLLTNCTTEHAKLYWGPYTRSDSCCTCQDLHVPSTYPFFFFFFLVLTVLVVVQISSTIFTYNLTIPY